MLRAVGSRVDEEYTDHRLLLRMRADCALLHLAKYFAVEMEQANSCLLNRQNMNTRQWCAAVSKLGSQTPSFLTQ